MNPTRLLLTIPLCLAVTTAAAQDKPWFLDLQGGVGMGRSISPRYFDTIGSQFTTNPTLGDLVLPHGIVNSNKSPAASIGVGRFLTDNLYLKGSYRYFGAYRVSGSATYLPAPGDLPAGVDPRFRATDIQQSQYSTATGAFLTLGGTYDLTQWLYLEATGESGASFIHSGGVHDASLHDFPGSQSFPQKWRANLAGGAGGGIGYRLLPNLDLILHADYDYLGTAITGITCHCIPGSPGEHGRNYLVSKLQTVVILAGIRLKM